MDAARPRTQILRSLEAGPRPVLIAGVCGPTDQAGREAELAVHLGCDAVLLSLAALRDADNQMVLEHCRRIAASVVVGSTCSQPSARARSRVLVPLLRHRTCRCREGRTVRSSRTLDVVIALAASGRRNVALYTGNDDAIVGDPLTPFPARHGEPPLHLSGGLLGQWAGWTRRAVELLAHCRTAVAGGPWAVGEPLRLLAVGADLTDANAALFDPQHEFAGCLPGMHGVGLRTQSV